MWSTRSLALLTVAAVVGVVLAGCATSSPGTNDEENLRTIELPAAYVAALGSLALDVASIEEASALLGEATIASEERDRDRDQISMDDGGQCYRNGEGHVVVEGPGGSLVEGTPEGDRRARWGNGWVDGEFEPGSGDGDMDRIRLRLRDGECVVEPPETPGDGPVRCWGPGGWAFTVEEADGAAVTYTITLGRHTILVAKSVDGDLTVTQPDGSVWTVAVQDDGTILATSPGGAQWVITITEAGVTATGGPNDRTFELLPG